MSAPGDEQSAFERMDDPLEDLAEARAHRWYELGRSPNVIVRQAYRMIVLVVGLTVVAAGIAMFVLPGPGILVVIAGLAILATEFVWARLLLQRARGYAAKAKEKALGQGGLGAITKRVTGRR
ncbi:MAG: PGPGW domain-containing protein [Acidimicrobiales bacterium]